MMTKKRIRIGLLSLGLLMVLAAIVFSVTYFVREDRLDTQQQLSLQELERYAGEYYEGSIVLQNTNREEAQMLAERFGAKLRITTDGSFATLTLPEGVTLEQIYRDKENRALLSKFSLDLSVKISELEEEPTEKEHLPVAPRYTVSDPLYSNQTYLNYLHMETVWSRYKGDGVTVAVIDTGIDTDHPEFAGKISEYSYNATEDKIVKDYTAANGGYDWSLIEDEQGHGTAVAGVIAAGMDGNGIVGIAPNVTLIVIKAECNEKGEFLRISDLVFGLYYAIERDADVVNMSFGSSINPYAAPARLAVDSDCILVAAAGNEGTPGLTYPAADPNVIGVGALAADSWELAEYSNFGDNSDIVAPGTVHTTKIGGEYQTIDGTSFSSPIVAATLALLKQQNRYIEYYEVQELLFASSYDLGALGEDFYYGYGALDISALLLEERGKVTFDMLTDELDDMEGVFIRNHTLQNLPEPERLYSVFDGWYYDIYCTDEVNWYADVWTSDLTVYANWVNEDDGVPYTYVILEDGTVEIRSYTGKRRYITIPDKIENRVVSSIGDFCFTGNRRIREINLPRGLTRIGASAFADCPNLLSMHIPDGVTAIPESAFENDARLFSVTFGENSRLTSIDGFAFQNTSFERFDLPHGVEYIGERAFSGCSRLNYFYASGSDLRTIGNFAFECSGLLRFEAPRNLESVNATAFLQCEKLSEFTVEKGNAYFTAQDGVLYNFTKTRLVAYPIGRAGESYTLPQNTEIVGTYAFAFAKIRSIDLVQARVIEGSAFESSRLEGVVIPDSVVTLGVSAFKSAEDLKSAQIGAGLDTIPAGAFCKTSSLRSVHILAGIKYMLGDIRIGGAFEKSGIEQITFAENSELVLIGEFVFAGTPLQEIDIPRGVVTIDGGAFRDTRALRTVTFAPESLLREIAGSTFSACAIQHIDLPDGVLSIGNAAFSDTYNLTTITFPEGLRTIGGRAFMGSALTGDIHIPKNVSQIGECAFTCHNLENIYVDDENAWYTDVDGVVYSKDQTVLTHYPIGNSRTSYTVIAGTQKVGNYSFFQAQKLRYAYFLEGLHTIGTHAFEECSGMISYHAQPQSLVYIEAYAFYLNTGATSYTLPQSLTDIGEYAFSYNTSLGSISIPDNVTRISRYAFAYDYNLRTIRLNDTSKLARISYAAFAYTGITSFRVPPNVSTIAQYAFEGSVNLKSVTFAKGSKLDIIPAYMFVGAGNLQTITFESGSALRSIAAHGFEGMSKLTTVDFGDAPLTNIDNYAFRYCENLKTINISESGVNYIGRFAFYGCKNLTELVLPTTIERIGRFAFYFAEKLNIYFKADTLPVALQENWDYGIRGYYVGVTNVETMGDWKYATLTKGGVAIIEYLGTGGEIDLAALSLGGDIVQIGGHAFEMADITSIVLPQTLREIHRNAFAYTDLASVSIPASVTFIGQSAFSASKLESVTFAPDAALAKIEPYAFAYTDRLQRIAIPASVTELQSFAFLNSGIEQVSFAEVCGLTKLSESVFAGSALTSVVIPDSVTYIDDNAFRDCLALQSVTLGSAPELEIHANVFYNTGLTAVHIPANVKYVGEYAFVGLTQLGAYSVDEANPYYRVIDGILYTKDARKLIAFPAGREGSFVVPAHVETIGFGAFENSKLSAVSFAEGINLLTLGYRAFYNARNLTTISVPATVVSIDYYAFAECRNLESVLFAKDNLLTGIYEGAFLNCVSLKNIFVPDSIKEISDYAFYGCAALTALPFAENAQIEGIYSYAFAHTGIRDLVIPDTVMDIGEYAFRGSRITELVIPSAQQKHLQIGIGAFRDCDELTKITIPFVGASLDGYFIGDFATVKADWFGYLFGAGSYAANSTYVPQSLKHVIISEGAESIGKGAFYDCSSLTSITIPSSVTSIGYYAFSGCSNLTIGFKAESLPATLGNNWNGGRPHYLNAKEFGSNENFEYLAFNDNTAILLKYIGNAEELTLDKIGEYTIVGSIPANMFNNHTELKRVIIGSGITSIGDYAFSGCSNLTIGFKAESLPATLGSNWNGGRPYYLNVKEFGSNENFEYAAHNDGTATLLKYIGNSEELTIDKIGESPIVGSIPANMFKEHTELKRVTIGNGITSIDFSAFSGCTGLTNITIPSSVTSIGSNTFYGCKSLTSITIPAGVTSIGDSAFSGCTSLTTVTFGENSQLTSIGTHAFYGCSGLTSITISAGVTSIGDSAFENCSSLASITIPAGVTSIGSSVFSGCRSLTSITIPSSVTSIGSSAFYNCSSLTSIMIPAGVTSIGDNAFLNCNSLTSITIPAGVTSIGYNAFYGCKSLTSITIPVGVTRIGDFAFRDCSNLTIGFKAESLPTTGINWNYGRPYYLNVKEFGSNENFEYLAFNDNTAILFKYIGNAEELIIDKIGEYTIVGSIPANMFKDHTELKRVIIGSGIASIGNYAFYNCSSLTTVTFGENSQLTSIGYQAFYGCSSLTSITIPASVTSIGNYAFYGCTSLTGVYITDIAKWCGIAFGSSDANPLSYAKNLYLNGSLVTDLVISASVTSIGGSAFRNCSSLATVTFGENSQLTSIGSSAFFGCSSLTSITIPAGVTSIGEYAFSGCSSLTSITFGENSQLTSIGRQAFLGCGNLTTVTFGENSQLTSIGQSAFSGCTGLTSITIPASVTSIGDSAFRDCSSLTSIEVSENNSNYCSVDGILYDKAQIEIIFVPRGLSGAVTIPAGVTNIGNYAFSGYSSLTTVTFEENSQLTSIGIYAFYGCTGLTSITIPAGVTNIGSDAFSGCSNLAIGFVAESLPTTLGSSWNAGRPYYLNVKEVSSDENFEYFILGDNTVVLIKYIGKTEELTLDKFGEYIIAGSIPAYMFQNHTELKRVTIGSGITSIGSATFAGCTGLASITIPPSVTSIGSSAFYNCSSLTTVTFGENSQLTSIGDSAFSSCSSLASITIPSSVTSIGYSAFSGCSSLTSITIPSSVTSIGNSAFRGCSSLTNITIPAGVTSIGSQAFYNCSNLTIGFKAESLPATLGSGWNSSNNGGGDRPHYLNVKEFGSNENFEYFALGDNTAVLIKYIGTAEELTLNKIGEYTVSIPRSMFRDHTELKRVIIGSGITSIGSYAFYGCSSLTTVIFDDNSQLTSIGDNAFNGCSALHVIYNNSDLPLSIGSSSYGYVAYYANLIVDKSGNKTYRSGINFEYVETPQGFRFIKQGVRYTLIAYIGTEGTITLPTDINGSFYEISNFRGGKNVIIPDTFTSIGSYAFRDCSSLTAVTFGENSQLTSIGYSAFSGCSNLTTVTFGENSQLTSIGDYAFSGCSSLTSITIPSSVTSIGWHAFSGCSSLTSITIPSSVTSIGRSAFSGCSSLTSITIPSSVTSIGYSAFSGCSNLTTVTFGENSQLTSIGDWAFYNCIGLTSITIPSSVTSIGYSAFSGCSSLISITIPSSVTSIGSSTFSGCSSLSSITIPSSVTSIGNYAFQNCSSLTTVTFGENSQLTSIGGYAFYGCTGLTSITIPASVTSIGTYAFYNCSSLTSITIPSSVTSIGGSAFYGCSKVTIGFMAETLPTTGSNWNYGANDIYRPYYLNVKEFGSNESFEYFTFDDNTAILLKYIGNAEELTIDKIGEYTIVGSIPACMFQNHTELKRVIIGSGITSIGSSAFSGCTGLTSITIPSGVTSIGSSAFSGCTGLTSITIPSGVTSIGNYAFSDCNSLTTVTFGENSQLTSIGNYAFRYCSSLTSITIPAGVTSIGNSAFSGCNNLTIGFMAESLPTTGNMWNYSSNGNRPYYLNVKEFGSNENFEYIGFNDNTAILLKYIGNAEELTIDKIEPYTVIGSIPADMFKDHTELKRVIIGSGITSIGNYAFDGCSGLATVTFGENSQLTSIGNSAFRGCSSLTNITIPAGVTSIGSQAFYNCSNLTIGFKAESLPTTGTSWNYSSNGNRPYYLNFKEFGSNENFEYVAHNDGTATLLKYIGNAEELIIDKIGEYTIGSVPAYMFSGHIELKRVIIGGGITSIGSSAFDDCSSLASITIPSSVMSIGSKAFYNCSSLTGITISAGVTSIGDSAFSGCTSLTGITIPSSVTSIGNAVFGGCSNLTTVTFGENSQLVRIGDYTFSGCTSLTTVTFGENSQLTSIGSSAFYDCSSLTSITIPAGVTSIEVYAFWYCNLTSVYIEDIASWCRIIFRNGSANPLSSADNLYLKGTLVTDMVLPASVTSIAQYAFYGCKSLTSITIPAGVTSIGSNAFYGCSNLTTVTFGENSQLTSIGSEAFYYCRSLTSITIPAGVTSIGSGAFYRCIKLFLAIEEGNTHFALIDGVLYNKEVTQILVLPDSVTNLVIPKTVTKCPYLGGNEMIVSVVFEEGSKIMSIPSRMFYDCRNLISITIPSSVTSIDSSAFSDCSGLATVTFGENSQLTSIGSQAFSGCTGLTSITIPSSVTSIGSSVFSGCRSLTSITIPSSVTSIGSSVFSGCRSLTSITIPSSVTSIGDNAFLNCNSLTSITIPAGVTSIGYNAFYGCSALYVVYNNSDLPLTIGSTDYGYVAYSANLIVDKSGNKIYRSGVDFEYVDTPQGFRFKKQGDKYTLIAYIGTEETITLPVDINGSFYDIDHFRGGVNVIIPDTFTSIGYYAFSGCSSLTSITIPSSVTSIGERVFSDCSSLATVTFGENSQLTSIGNYAFYGCKSLTSITIPTSVTSIGERVFVNCSSLASVTFGENSQLTSIGSCAFSGCTNLATIHYTGSPSYVGINVLNDTAYYNDPTNWRNGVLYVGNAIIAISKDATAVTWPKETIRFGNDISGCHSLETIAAPHNYSLFDLSNVKNIKLYTLPQGTLLNFPFGYWHQEMPLTLKNVVITKGCMVRSANLFKNITGVNIFVEDIKIATQWDHDYPGWNNGNRVYYGGEWIEAIFEDSDGNILSWDYYTNYQIVRQPFVKDVIDGPVKHVFLGWDTDGDGLVDGVPATSTQSIHARAVMKTVDNVCRINFYDVQGHLYATREYVWGQSIELPEAPTRKGYTFLVWRGYTKNMTASENIDFYADWQHEGDGHSFVTTMVDPTCTLQGYRLRVCSICGDEQRDEFTAPYCHTYGEWVVDTAPTCSTNGERHRICETCAHREEELLHPHGHSFACIERIASTCTKQGSATYECRDCHMQRMDRMPLSAHNYEKQTASAAWVEGLAQKMSGMFFGYEGGQVFYYRCADCGHILTTQASTAGVLSAGASIASKGCTHEPGDWVVEKEATAEEYGYKVRYCKLCNTVVEARTTHTGDHVFGEYSYDFNATCTTDGTETAKCIYCDETHTRTDVGSALGHSYSNVIYIWSKDKATCTATRVCSHDDSHVETETVDSVATITQQKSCTTDELTKYTATFTNPAFAQQTKENVKTADALGHSFTNYVSDGNATCTADGTETAKCDRCEATDTRADEDSALGHSFTNYVSDGNATCAADGTETAKCDRCEATDTRADEDSALGHSFTNYVSDGNATCLADGTETAKCDRCDATDTRADEDSALGHSFTNYVSDGNATCLADGTETAKCDRCDATDTRADEDSALGHNYGDIAYTWSDDNSQCTAKRTCSRDNSHVETETVDSVATITQQKSCTADELTKYTATFTNPAFATQTKENVKTADALGHSFTNYVSDGNATCLADGTETAKCNRCDATDTRADEDSALGHNYGEVTYTWSDDNSTCTATRVCSRDNSHVETETANSTSVVTQAQSCTNDELTKYTATFTNPAFAQQTKENMKTADALGHSFTNYVSDGNATCTTDGTETAKCDRCDATDTRADEDSALGHNYGEVTYTWSDDNTQCTAKRTCSRDGSHIETETANSTSVVTQAQSCLNDELTKYTATFTNPAFAQQTKENVETADALGHGFTNYVSDGNATCLADGTETAKCDRCEATDTRTEADSALGHSFTNYISDGNATCTADGTETAKCDRCDATDTRADEDSALGHSFTNYVSDGNATCTADGTETAKCDRCDATDTRADEDSALGHSFTNYVSDGNAICTADGTETAKCDRCDATDTRADEDSALGHNYGEATYIWSDNNSTCTAKRVCAHDGSHIETETANSTSVVTQAQSCLNDELTKYTATFTNPAFAQQTKENVKTADALGHNYGEVTYTWSDDNSQCTAKRICSRDNSHIETETVDSVATITQQKSCTADELTKYTATFTNPAFAQQTKENVKTADALGHSFTNYVSDGNATCTADGTEIAKCDRCDATDTRADEDSALGHSYGEVTYTWSDDNSQCTAKRTCTHDASHIETETANSTSVVTQAQSCLNDELTKYTATFTNPAFAQQTKENIKTADALGHSFTNYVSDGNATCTADGTETAKCDRCDATDTRADEDSALGHSFTNYVSDGNATCTADGTETAKCDRCDATDTRADEDSALGHSFTNYVSDGNATCTTDGTETAKCDRCDATDTRTEADSALGHSYGEATYTWSDDNSQCTAKRTCSRDGSHIETETVDSVATITQQKSCTADELTKYTVTFTNPAFVAQVKENIKTADALGHSFTNYVSDGNATCTADGTETAKCDRCDATDTRADEDSALGHSYGEVTYTWSDDNSQCTAKRICSRDNSHVETETVDSVATITQQKSCTNDELTKYTATFTNPAFAQQTKENVKTADALGHSFTNYVSDGNATCTADGTETAKCDRCDATDTRADEDSALGHSFTNYVSDGNATCLADGTETAKCDRCDATDTRADEDSALGHSFTNYVSDGNATCTADGTETAKCDRCDATDTRADEDSALGHNYGEVTYTWSDNNSTCTAKRVCSRDNSHVETETANSASVVTQAQSCLNDELTKYTVTFTNPAFAQQTKENVKTADAFGHAYGEVTYTWSDDNSQCTAKRTCSRDNSHVETETVDSVATITQQKFCTADELTKYTATFTNPAFAQQTKENVKTADALGHSFTNYVSDGNATCTADGTETAKCDRCEATDTRTEADSALGHSFTNYVSDGNATCLADGTETAKCDRCDATDTRADEDSALGHSYGEVTYTWSDDNSQCTAKRTCSHDGSHIETETANSASVVTQAQSCLNDELTKYTATFTNPAFAQQTKENVKTADALGHSFANFTESGATCSACGLVHMPHNYENGICAICGYVQTNRIYLSTAQVSLGSDISMKFFAAGITDENEGNIVLRVTRNGETITLTPILDAARGRYYFRYEGITPQCMSDAITAELVDTNANEVVYTLNGYSVMKNLETIKGSDSFSPAAKQLAKDMLVYGAAAQVYRNYKTETLVTTDAIRVLDLPTSKLDLKNSAQADAPKFSSVTLRFDNVNKLRFYFKASDVTGVSATVNGKAVSFTDCKDGKYMIETGGIYASKFSEQLEVKLFVNGTEVSVIRYSVYDYIASAQNLSNEGWQNLVKALYAYGDSAKAFAESGRTSN